MKFAEDHFQNDEERLWYQQMVRHVLGHAPSCLEGFQTERVPLENDLWDERVEWKIACPCGGKNGRILGYPPRDFKEDYQGPVVFVSPLAFQCGRCDRVIELMDTARHGYDGECGHGSATIRGHGDRSPFACRACNAMSFRVVTCFQHSHFDIIEEEPELEPVAQNYFDWFQCVGTCSECGEEQSIGDYELA